ncbi:MAG: NAD(P)/FAD-dependent oxidoreductase [Candidatus Krumholzibacteria bacterium]|nr:NAD(P)/FAD-dependent oxidoreductase [Candidatus Krumholzibacteria bacterium]
MDYDLVVIGGGAAGMLAAGRAAENGLEVLLLERNNRLGKKLGITGKGRCNITNSAETERFIENFGKKGKFLYGAITRFTSSDLVRFFAGLGVETKEERGGRIFPANDKASTVVKALERYARSNGVVIELSSRVDRIVTGRESGAVEGVILKNDRKTISSGKTINANETINTGKVLLATGGKSYPATGSTGDGYAIAASLGHTIVKPRQSLVPFDTGNRFVRDLQGLSLKNVEVTVFTGGRKTASGFGEMLFTHFGVSGPVILTLSGQITDDLAAGKTVELSIDFKPALTGEKLDKRLIREFADSGTKHFRTVMKNLLPNRLIPVFITLSGIAPEKKCSQITSTERNNLAALLKDLRLTIKRPRPFEEAIITRGGIDLKEIDPRTMRSKLVDGLYFCGEVIDIDGNTGGYNLQAAFSTAWLAAEACSNLK